MFHFNHPRVVLRRVVTLAPLVEEGVFESEASAPYLMPRCQVWGEACWRGALWDFSILGAPPRLLQWGTRTLSSLFQRRISWSSYTAERLAMCTSNQMRPRSTQNRPSIPTPPSCQNKPLVAAARCCRCPCRGPWLLGVQTWAKGKTHPSHYVPVKTFGFPIKQASRALK